jgi:hypothetical protein
VLTGEPPPEALAFAATVVTLLFKVGILYGSVVRALLAVRRIDDPLDRKGLRRFILLQLGGLLAFELAGRDVTWLAGLHTPDAVIALVQVGGAYPALVWLGVFLRRREVAERLFISPDTVKKHTYNAYRKLGVQNRVARRG